ncbi:MAG TPA: hypothetical protein VF313_10385 [Anaerolineaceae bacterium]
MLILKIFSPEQFFIAKREKNNLRRIIIMNMKRIIVVWPMLLMLALTLLAGCASSSGSSQNSALSADNINLIFVVSPDLLYNTPGDIQPDTANLTSQGLNRSLQMATYLKQQVLGGNNVTAIYALAPMTHLQTTPTYSDIPDMTAIGFIQQFALLNQITLTVKPTPTYTSYTANNYTINTSYASAESLPLGVPPPTSLMGDALTYCPTCKGLDFKNAINNNDTLVSSIINKNIPGFYVFSAPWETTSALLTNIKTTRGYNLNLPTTYLGSNFVYVISITPSGSASLVTYNSNLTPPSTYPVLPAPVQSAACRHLLQPWFKAVRTGGVDGVTVPPLSNTNQRVYIVRHAEAHPDPAFEFEDGNYVGAGQWRALALSNALRGKISPNMVYSIDPAQFYPTSIPYIPSITPTVSYVRPSLTVLPYAIANNLPFYLAAKFSIVDALIADEGVAKTTSNFFFTHSVDGTGVNLSGQIILLAWESGHIRPFLNELLKSYGGKNPPQLQVVDPPPDGWPDADYDTIWTVTLDAQGNLTVDNDLCEGIDSASLPATAPQF